jgi:pyruvate dehydrogenase E1 component alpha subunit
LECLTYRFRGHSLADPDELRDPEEKAFWAQRDPIKQFAALLNEKAIATNQDLEAIDQEIDELVRDAVEFALAAPEPDPRDLTRYIWAED